MHRPAVLSAQPVQSVWGFFPDFTVKMQVVDRAVFVVFFEDRGGIPRCVGKAENVFGDVWIEVDSCLQRFLGRAAIAFADESDEGGVVAPLQRSIVLIKGQQFGGIFPITIDEMETDQVKAGIKPVGRIDVEQLVEMVISALVLSTPFISLFLSFCLSV